MIKFLKNLFKAKDFQAADIIVQPIGVGNVFTRDSKNPFEEIYDVKVLDIKGDYVQYIFVKFPDSGKYSSRIKDFLLIYKKVSNEKT
jgi:hypothetical protein